MRPTRPDPSPSTLPVEAAATVGEKEVLLAVGLGHLQRTAAGKRICIDLAAAPYGRRLYIWLRDVHRLEADDAPEERAYAALPH